VPAAALEAAEAKYREFVDGLTEALNDAGVPAMPSWPDAIEYLVDMARGKCDALRTMLTSDEAVEAAAREAFWQDDVGGHIKGRWTWETIPDDGRENYRQMVRAALAAAADAVLSLPAPGDPGCKTTDDTSG
jgi:hypothetical protein